MNCGVVLLWSIPNSAAFIQDNNVATKIDNICNPDILIGKPVLFFGNFRSAIIKPPEINIIGKIIKSKYGFSTVDCDGSKQNMHSVDTSGPIPVAGCNQINAANVTNTIAFAGDASPWKYALFEASS